MLDIAGTQEIPVQRMHRAPVFHGLLRGRQSLAKHLTTEHVAGADIPALPTEQVALDPLQLEQRDQFVYRWQGHAWLSFGGLHRIDGEL